MLSGASQSRVGCVSYYSANDTITPAMSTVARLASNHPMHRATLELEVEDVSAVGAELQANGVKLVARRAHYGLGVRSHPLDWLIGITVTPWLSDD